MNGARRFAGWLVVLAVCAGCTTATPGRSEIENANTFDPAAAQALITAFGTCVRDEGFEFVDPGLLVASPPNPQVRADEYFDDDDGAQIQSIGYGIVDTFRSEIVAEQQSPIGTSDPNAAIYADLAEPEREQYLLVYNECSEQFPFRSSIAVDEIDTLAEDIYNRTVTSDGYLSAMTGWSRCFSDQTGERFATPDEVPEVLINKLGTTYTYEASEDLMFDPGPFDIGVKRVVDEGLLRSLEATEMNYAQVDFDCQRQNQLVESVNDAFEKAQE